MQADAGRRRSPRVWDTDWLVLRELATALDEHLASIITNGTRLVDFGCGSMPYRRLVENRGGTYVGADFDTPDGLTISAAGDLHLPDASTDAVLSVQVLEHVRDIDK